LHDPTCNYSYQEPETMAFYSKIPDYEIMEDEAPMTDYVRQNSIKLNNSELPKLKTKLHENIYKVFKTNREYIKICNTLPTTPSHVN